MVPATRGLDGQPRRLIHRSARAGRDERNAAVSSSSMRSMGSSGFTQRAVRSSGTIAEFSDQAWRRRTRRVAGSPVCGLNRVSRRRSLDLHEERLRAHDGRIGASGIPPASPAATPSATTKGRATL